MNKWLIFAGIVAGLWPDCAEAHRMDLACSAKDKELVIEAWVGNGEAVVDGEVTIATEDGTILTTGKTDENGFYHWTPDPYRTITVSVYAGQGHKESLTVTKEEMESLFAQNNQPEPVNENMAPPSSDADTEKATVRPSQSARISTQNALGTPERIILGLTLILAGMAAWMSYRNSRILCALEELLKKHEG